MKDTVNLIYNIMKNLFVFGVLAIMAMACTKEERLADLPDTEVSNSEIGIISLSSKEELKDLIENGTTTPTRASDFGIKNLMTSINSVDILSDPILSVEASRIGISNPASKNVYDTFGYDYLVPNENFASLLNAKGEIQVRDTIYKISPRGTFYFQKDALAVFEANYDTLLDAPVTKLSEGRYIIDVSQVDSSLQKIDIYIADTYQTGCDTWNKEFYEEVDPYYSEAETNPAPGLTKASGEEWIEALDIDWNSQEVFYTDSHTWVGGILQDAFGRNVNFDTEFDNKHRIKTRMYYYDYVVYSEIGATTKMQKKNWIGAWVKTPATEIYQIWNNMVIRAELTSRVEYPHTGNGENTPRHYLCTVQEEIPGSGLTGNVAYYAGRPLTDAEYESLANEDYVQAVIDMNVSGDVNLSERVHAMKYICEDGIYTVVYPFGKIAQNTDEVKSLFSKDFHIMINFSLSGLTLPSNTFKNWLDAVSAQSLKAPELLQGELRSAAKYEGAVKGMRLIKTREQ